MIERNSIKAPVLIPDYMAFIRIVRNMYDRGEITLEQYAESLRRIKDVRDNPTCQDYLPYQYNPDAVIKWVTIRNTKRKNLLNTK